MIAVSARSLTPPQEAVLNTDMLFDEDTVVSDLVAEQRMYPTRHCMYGFLSEGENLQQRIKEDADAMAERGLACEGIAKRIEEIFASKGEHWNGHPLLKPQYIAGMRCPWNDFLSSSVFSMVPEVREIIIIHRDKLDEAIAIMERFDMPPETINVHCYGDLVRADVAMILSELHPHLLRVHKFCQGLHTPYRIAPERVEEYLGVK